MKQFCIVRKLEDRSDGATVCYYNRVVAKTEKAALAAFQREETLPTHVEWEEKLLERGETLLFI